MQTIDTMLSPALDPVKDDWNFLEVWIDPMQSPPYLLMLISDCTGAEHVLLADAGCRNTVFNGTAQTGTEFVQRFLEIGVRHFRLEFVNESPAQVLETISRYQQLLAGKISGSKLWKKLKLQNQLGVTRGSLE